ncbi:hypothetical protein L7F22_028849 [Adiantum nelumboides]|nr:hypothetical protein [Adiantum nelumboides]
MDGKCFRLLFSPDLFPATVPAKLERDWPLISNDLEPPRVIFIIIVAASAPTACGRQGIFMNPVDDTDAPNYSKSIKNPMCFLRMREKIYTKQYTTWFSFVEDFEHICCNAMIYNQKWSQIWNAANMMLRKGRRCLEQQFAKHDVILGINVMHKDHNYQGEGAADGNLGPPVPVCFQAKNSLSRVVILQTRTSCQQ